MAGVQAAASPDGASGEPNRGRLSLGEVQAVVVILLVGLLVRAIFMPMHGHETDIGTFESWMLSVIKYGIPGFYRTCRLRRLSAGLYAHPRVLWRDLSFSFAVQPAGRFAAPHGEITGSVGRQLGLPIYHF